ncbi:hypothetical protein E3T55_01035, partial [Cryobacterium frigoriphilum]
GDGRGGRRGDCGSGRGGVRRGARGGVRGGRVRRVGRLGLGVLAKQAVRLRALGRGQQGGVMSRSIMSRRVIRARVRCGSVGCRRSVCRRRGRRVSHCRFGAGRFGAGRFGAGRFGTVRVGTVRVGIRVGLGRAVVGRGVAHAVLLVAGAVDLCSNLSNGGQSHPGATAEFFCHRSQPTSTAALASAASVGSTTGATTEPGGTST